jgi:peptidoglycan/xylan/chitin deacetylase (PgdA/CDA1 family)
MILTDRTFEKLLECLHRRFQVTSLDDLFIRESPETTKPKCLLTFDDGWSDTYNRAFPLLKKFSMPAMVFVTTGTVGQQRGSWVEQLRKAWRKSSYRAAILSGANTLDKERARYFSKVEEIVDWLKRMPAQERDSILGQLLPGKWDSDQADEIDSMLSWDQVVELSRHGIEFGTHTVNHPLLSYEDDTTVERELRVSKIVLEAKIGTEVRAFAYPNGDYNERVSQCVERLGYRCAFTTKSGWHRRTFDRYAIHRILLHEDIVTGYDGEFSSAMLSLTLAGWN